MPSARSGFMYPERAKPPSNEESSHHVEHVIDIEAVSRPLLIADARQGAVQTVSEPIECERKNHKEQGQGVPVGCP